MTITLRSRKEVQRPVVLEKERDQRSVDSEQVEVEGLKNKVGKENLKVRKPEKRDPLSYVPPMPFLQRLRRPC